MPEHLNLHLYCCDHTDTDMTHSVLLKKYDITIMTFPVHNPLWALVSVLCMMDLMSGSEAHGAGAPLRTCTSMTPLHGSGQVSAAPYTIRLDSTTFNAGDKITGNSNRLKSALNLNSMKIITLPSSRYRFKKEGACLFKKLKINDFLFEFS